MTFRIGPLANLPVFFKLEGKRVLLVGGGEPALWKAELLAATGGLVDVVSESFADGFRALAASPPAGRITLIERRWSDNDLLEAALAVGSFSDDRDAKAFATAARSAGVPVNIVDRPKLCDFQFGAVVNRSPLILGISTDGAAPVFGQAVRSLIEGLLPESFRHWAEAARDLRREGDRFGKSSDAKRRFWQRFTDLALRYPERGPTATDIDRLGASDVSDPVAAVTIIDVDESPDTLTLAAIRALRAADDIYFDDGVPPSVLDFGRREARRHPVGGGQGVPGPIREAMIGAVRAGKPIVRVRLRAAHEGSAEARLFGDAGLRVIHLSSGTTV